MLWKQFNDQLGLLVMVLIMVLWAAIGTGRIVIPGEVTGATIAVFTMVAQYYFRKAPPDAPPTA